MNTKDLSDFIDLHHEWLRKHYDCPDKQKEILARTVKLSEEVGELCEQILSFNSLQLKRKLDNFKKENLDDEFADVIVTTLLLAKSADVDIRKAVENKIAKTDISKEDK